MGSATSFAEFPLHKLLGLTLDEVRPGFSRIKARMLYVLSRTDALFPPSLAPDVMAALSGAGVDARYAEIDSEHGHLASGADAAKWAPALAAFTKKLEAKG